MIGSLIVGASLGLVFAFAPDYLGDTAITDPVLLGLMWFVRPRSLLVVAPPLLHFVAGAVLQVITRWTRTRANVSALAAVGLNGAATAVENAYGAGVMGVGWWLLGSILSAALMLLGIAAARRVARP